jgi:hypothetical protein
MLARGRPVIPVVERLDYNHAHIEAFRVAEPWPITPRSPHAAL